MGTGRKPIQIRQIADTRRRRVTLTKRRQGIFSKLKKLQEVTGVDMFCSVFTTSGRVFDFEFNDPMILHDFIMDGDADVDGGVDLQGLSVCESNGDDLFSELEFDEDGFDLDEMRAEITRLEELKRMVKDKGLSCNLNGERMLKINESTEGIRSIVDNEGLSKDVNDVMISSSEEMPRMVNDKDLLSDADMTSTINKSEEMQRMVNDKDLSSEVDMTSTMNKSVEMQRRVNDKDLSSEVDMTSSINKSEEMQRMLNDKSLSIDADMMSRGLDPVLQQKFIFTNKDVILSINKSEEMQRMMNDKDLSSGAPNMTSCINKSEKIQRMVNDTDLSTDAHHMTSIINKPGEIRSSMDNNGDDMTSNINKSRKIIKMVFVDVVDVVDVDYMMARLTESKKTGTIIKRSSSDMMPRMIRNGVIRKCLSWGAGDITLRSSNNKLETKKRRIMEHKNLSVFDKDCQKVLENKEKG